MSKRRSRLADFAVYIGARLLVCVIQILSFPAACRFAAAVAVLIHWLDHRHRAVAHENLRHAFQDQWTESQRELLVRQVYAHFCRVLVEIFHLPRRLHANTWKRHVNLAGAKTAVDCLLSGRPLLLVTGHFGNWEMGGYVLGLLGFKTHAVARPLDN